MSRERNELVEANLDICWRVVNGFLRRFPTQSWMREDLEAEARLSLVKSYDCWNGRGDFRGWAYWYIRADVRRASYALRPGVRVPRGEKGFQQTESMDVAVFEDGEPVSSTLPCPLPSPELAYLDREREEIACAALASLGERNAKVFIYNAMCDKSNKAAGNPMKEHLPVSRERARQLKVKLQEEVADFLSKVA